MDIHTGTLDTQKSRHTAKQESQAVRIHRQHDWICRTPWQSGHEGNENTVKIFTDNVGIKDTSEDAIRHITDTSLVSTRRKSTMEATRTPSTVTAS
jgi:hypothetical protein